MNKKFSNLIKRKRNKFYCFWIKWNENRPLARNVLFFFNSVRLRVDSETWSRFTFFCLHFGSVDTVTTVYFWGCNPAIFNFTSTKRMKASTFKNAIKLVINVIIGHKFQQAQSFQWGWDSIIFQMHGNKDVNHQLFSNTDVAQLGANLG